MEDAHGAYLRFREMTTLCGAFIIVSTVCGAYFDVRGRQLLLGELLLILEYLTVMIAARNAATQFVAKVLAIESATISVDPSGQESS